MQFNLEKSGGVKLIESYSDGSVTIEGRVHTTSLILMGDHVIDDWSVESVEDLTIEHLQSILQAGPEIFLLGTGNRQVFPSVRLMKELAQHQRSIDVMDIGAACRTYNVLASEFRTVAAALILGSDE